MLTVMVLQLLHELDVSEPDHDHSCDPPASLATMLMELHPLLGWVLEYLPQTSKFRSSMAEGK